VGREETMPKKILVTGVGGGSGMYTAKILKESGYYVVGTDANGFAAGSVLCDEFCVISKASNREDFVRDIKRLLERFEIDVVLPNVDEELIIFAEEGLKSIISSPDAVGICLDKFLFYNVLKSDFLMPHTSMVYNMEWAEFSGKVIVKPTRGRGSKGIYVFDNIAKVDLVKFPLAINYGHIVQEYIEGKEITVDVLVGRENRAFIAPRYRIGTYGGISQVGKTVYHDKAMKTSWEICGKLDFRGPINIQFIEEDGTKDLFLMEINPRLSGGIGITYANGANVPDMAIKEHFGEVYDLPELREDMIFRHFVEKRDEKGKNRDC
jgi:carbamoyl-phosphate synthase large subunit